MPRKTKTTQPEKKEAQNRDLFQTPNYAVDLLIPFIPKKVEWVWEPACGDGKIVQRLTENGLGVYPSDIRKSSSWVNNHVYNFLTGDDFNYYNYPRIFAFYKGSPAIITNPPFSLKHKFYLKCLEYKLPFALLIPADYSGWLIKACAKEGCEKIIPTRRIDYITPNILRRIHEGELWNLSKETWFNYETLEQFKKEKPDIWKRHLENNEHFCNYNSIDDVPTRLLVKYSSSDFHSLWLTWGFGLGKTETYVELTLEQKKGNI